MILSVLGSTGSIGTQTLEIVRAHREELSVYALCARASVELLERQAREFSPKLAVLLDEDAARELKTRLADTNVEVASGREGVLRAAAEGDSQTVVTALVGTAGLLPTLEAIRAGKRIALANKETLVCAGELVTATAREYGAEIVPVDSEHSAIFQSLLAGKRSELRRILLTASGGPFRGWSREKMRAVTPQMALAHPNWSMGPKVTVDSATMMNKGLELIEAMHLFSVSPEQIRILVHPQSIVHSAVEFEDGSVIAQMGAPDMRIPIQYALTYPNRAESPARKLDLTGIGTLTFEEPDTDAFPCLKLARDAASAGGVACAVLNAANEEAVRLFLDGEIRFYDIPDFVSAAMESVDYDRPVTLDDVLEADGEARDFVRQLSRNSTM